MGAGRTDAPVGDAPADEAVPADDTGPGHGRAEPGVGPLPEDQRWIAWAPGGGERADAAPSAGGAQEPADAGARDEEARPAGSPASSRDSVPDVGDEKEETAPSPWSIPLSLVGDLDEMEDDGVWHVPDAGTADDAEQPAADDGLSADGHDDEDAADGEGKPERGHDGDAARMAAPGPGALPLTVDDADATKSAGETAGTPAISGQNGAEGGPAREEVASPARVEPVAEDPAEVNASGEPDHADDVPRASTADQAPAAGEAATHDEASASGSAPDASASGSEPGSSETRAAAAGPTGESAGAAADSGARAGADAEETSSATATPSANASEPSAGDLQPDSGRDSSSSANGGPRPAASATSASPAGGDRQEVNEEVTMVPGVARYHRSGCILIRFLGGDDLETTTRQAAEADGCIPCRACEPDKPLSADRT
jgi:hypothetical protein